MSLSPFSESRFRLLFAAGWLLWSCVHAWLLHWYGTPTLIALEDSLVSNLMLVLAALVITNSLRYYLPSQDRLLYLFSLTTLIALVWFFVSRALLLLIPGNKAEYDVFWSFSVPIRMAVGFLVLGTNTLVSVLWFTVQQQQHDERRKAETLSLVKEAELYKLKEQLSPHFLFNSLNSINALIGFQPDKARTMIQQLSDFLRGTLKKDENQWATLHDELEHLQLYLDIEKVRFGHRLNTEVVLEPDHANARIPAMLLQPVVENAIKFGLYDTTDAITISLHSALQQGKLIITVSNPYDPATALQKKGTGFGLRSVERRLFLLFGQSGLLKTQTAENTFTTILTIPQ